MMRMLTVIIEFLSFSFALWLGCYLLARNSAKAVLRLTGLGLVAYAFSLAGSLLSVHAPTNQLIALFGVVHQGLLFLPALCWVGATIHLLPETTPLRTRLQRAWLVGLVPLALLGYISGISTTIIPAGYPLLALILFLPLLGGLGLVAYTRRTARPARLFSLMLIVTLFLTLGTGLLLFPLNWLPRTWSVLAIGIDLELLGLAIAVLDAFDEGETLLPAMLRSFVAAGFLALLFGLQIVLLMLISTGLTFATLLLLLTTTATAILLQTFASHVQTLLDRLAFAQLPHLRQARAELRTQADALPRINQELALPDLDEAEFTRLTRRALSHYGDLPRLATSPLTNLPTIKARLMERNARDDPLERAVELKALLAGSIARLKPRGPDDFGTSDEWRYYNALYFPYVVGLKPYSRRATHNDLDPTARAALEWLRTSVPERTLYNWQNAAARLVAQDLRGEMEPPA